MLSVDTSQLLNYIQRFSFYECIFSQPISLLRIISTAMGKWMVCFLCASREYLNVVTKAKLFWYAPCCVIMYSNYRLILSGLLFGPLRAGLRAVHAQWKRKYGFIKMAADRKWWRHEPSVALSSQRYVDYKYKEKQKDQSINQSINL